MIIFPAIDLINGKVVRLTEGDYNKVTNYDASPVQTALNFANSGATHLHVVDLDGAKLGKAVNAETISQIVNASNMFVEVGGGIRSESQIEEYLSRGASRVILGTAAVKDEQFLKRCVKNYGDKISVGVDAKNGFVAVNGWKEITNINSVDFCRRLCDIGIFNIIYTDISKDGTLNGTNIEIYEVLCQTQSAKITASGGISSIKEIKKLAKMNLYGAIIGKAVYEGKINLREAISAAENKDVS